MLSLQTRRPVFTLDPSKQIQTFLQYHLLSFILQFYQIANVQQLSSQSYAQTIESFCKTYNKFVCISFQFVYRLRFASILPADRIKLYSIFHINQFNHFFVSLDIIITNYHMYSFAQDLVFNCLNLYYYDNFAQKWPNQPDEGDYFNQIQNECEAISPNIQRKEQIQKLAPTGSSNQDIQAYNESFESPTFSNHFEKVAFLPRQKTLISYSKSSNSQREACIIGKSYETQNIGKHLKSITMKYLELLQEARMLHPYEIKALIIFNMSNGSIKDFQILFNIQRLCLRCRKFYSSKNFISTVMSSPKMDFNSKLMMIKYGERLRSLTYSKLKRWRQYH